MSNLIVIARIIEHSPSQFIVVVSTAPETGGTTDGRSDLELADTPTRHEAIARQNRMIGAVVDRAERRGDRIVRVQRL